MSPSGCKKVGSAPVIHPRGFLRCRKMVSAPSKASGKATVGRKMVLAPERVARDT